MRVPYSRIFEASANGSVSPKMTIQVGGVTIGTAASFLQGALLGGIDLAALQGKDLEVEQTADDVVVISGHYDL